MILKTSFSLREGYTSRIVVLLAVEIDPKTAAARRSIEVDEAYCLSAETVVIRFLRSVEAKCFSGDGKVIYLDKTSTPESYLVRAEIPRLPRKVFDIMAGMLEASIYLGSGAISLLVQEEISGSVERSVSGEGADSESGSRAKLEVIRSVTTSAKSLRINISAQNEFANDDLSALLKVIESWSDLLAGGFPSPETYGISGGQLVGVYSHVPSEVEAVLEFYNASEEAWAILIQGLENQDLTAEIDRVIID